MKPLSLLALCLAVLLSACRQNAPQTPPAVMRVTTVRAVATELPQTLHLSGSLVAREAVAVGTALQGQRIVSVSVDTGDRVTRGQILAELEGVSVESQLQQTQAQLVRARANLRAQQAAAAEAIATFRRYQTLIRDNAVSRQDFDQRESMAATARANVQVAKAEIAQLQAQLKDSRNQRGKAMITAPVDGIIARRDAEAGALAGADALFHIIRDGEIELAVDAGADELPLIRAGTPAQVRVRGHMLPLQGTVRLVSPEMNADTRLGKVRIALPGQKGLYVGTYGEAWITLPAHHAAMALPVQAVAFDAHGKASVMMVSDDGVASRRNVDIGRMQGGMVEILSGLQPGNQVIHRASAFVDDGDRVQPRDVARSTGERNREGEISATQTPKGA